MKRARVSTVLAPRVTWRDAAVFVARALQLDKLADRLALREDPAPSDAERAALTRALARARVHAAMGRLSVAMSFDRPARRKVPGRQGAPSRDWLRQELRAVVDLVRGRAKDADVLKACAALLMLYGLDQHAVFWTRAGHPPKGRARLRYLAKRIYALTDERTGIYAERKARREADDM